MLEIIARLLALKNTLKLYHWNIVGETFNSDHPYLDEIHEPLEGYIDSLVEKYFMAVERKELSKLFDIFQTESSQYYGQPSTNPNEIFKQIENLILKLLEVIDEMDSYRGVNAVLDEISSHLLKSLGLIKGRLQSTGD